MPEVFVMEQRFEMFYEIRPIPGEYWNGRACWGVHFTSWKVAPLQNLRAQALLKFQIQIRIAPPKTNFLDTVPISTGLNQVV